MVRNALKELEKQFEKVKLLQEELEGGLSQNNLEKESDESDLSQKISLRNRLMKKGRACEERKGRHRQRSSATTFFDNVGIDFTGPLYVKEKRTIGKALNTENEELYKTKAVGNHAVIPIYLIINRPYPRILYRTHHPNRLWAQHTSSPPIESICGLPESRYLDGTNYSEWKFAMKNYLPCDSGDVRKAVTANQAWEKLRCAYEDNGLVRRIGLYSSLFKTRFEECGSMTAYIDRITGIADQLEAIGKPLDDETVGGIILGGLPIEFQPLIFGIQGSNQKIMVGFVKGLLLQNNVQQLASPLFTDESCAFVSQSAKKKAIKSKWVFKTKYKEDGTIEKRKARLVAKGYSQLQGIDYEDTFAPTLGYSSLRYLLSLAAKYNLEVDQMDVVTAFLNPSLNEEIYMELPTGVGDENNKYCRLRKSIYGLKQASRAWYGMLDDILRSFGLNRLKNEPCIYFLWKNKIFLAVGVYVDDLLILSNNESSKNELKMALCERFKMKDLGKAHWCLGIRIVQDVENGTLSIDQERYIEELLHRFRMSDCKEVKTPLDHNQALSKAMMPRSDEEIKQMHAVPYREAVGCLVYLSQSCRPDICHAATLARTFKQTGHILAKCPFVLNDRRPSKNQKKSDKHLAASTNFAASCLLIQKATDGDKDWFLDSGATTHLTHRDDWMEEYNGRTTHTVAIANGTNITTKGCGVVKIPLATEKTMVAHDVRHAPELALNLLSVSRIAAQIFDENGCRIVDLAVEVPRQHILGTATQYN
ncbi:Retrovirus-related Pol polyprotein from transposon TNT 1-94 [Trichinella nativa]|uniref:Retrovirus-related Pol polyprotein from transposon TNT 1-94 n=2 Tax=Trichinella nativa TaxID=6335 RepID=A0A0V1LKZ5_9BILA|nr:Retrovirus-related Pol polyprotein from transposon TNT 1-94 [Trichinella nativa]